MSELNEMGCREFSDVAAELALGVLTGRERAQALAHLDHCASCREEVRAADGDRRGAAGPAAQRGASGGIRGAGDGPAWPRRARPGSGQPGSLDQPAGPPGPEPCPPARRRAQARPAGRTRRVLALAAVTLAVVAAGLGGWGLRPGTPAPAGAPLSSATLLSASHQAAGKIFLYQGSSRWLYMSVDMPAGNGTVICEVESGDGHITTVGSFRLTDGRGYWGSPVPPTQGSLTGARLVGPGGTVLATASFHSA